MSKELLKVKIPEFKIDDKTLLKNIEFSLHRNEFLIVIGRNGAGKSTLLKHLTDDLTNPLSQVEIFDKNLKQYKLKDLAKRRAVLPQSTHLNFAYEVLEVVLLGRIPHQVRQVETELDYKIAFECLERVGLSDYATRNYLTLSGGEQQRVHLARALAQISSQTDEDKIFLLDEPTSSLDIAHQYQSLDILKELSKTNVGVLAIIHDLNLASQYADKILILNNGQTHAFGTPKEVLTPEILQSAFDHKVTVMPHPEHDCPLIISGRSHF